MLCCFFTVPRIQVKSSNKNDLVKRQRQKDHKFKTSLSYIGDPVLKKLKMVSN
jgi:hypothetical protein